MKIKNITKNGKGFQKIELDLKIDILNIGKIVKSINNNSDYTLYSLTIDSCSSFLNFYDWYKDIEYIINLEF